MVTINPADALPGEVYEGTVDGERLLLFRRSDEYWYPWESLDRLHDHADVSELVRLVPESDIATSGMSVNAALSDIAREREKADARARDAEHEWNEWQVRAEVAEFAVDSLDRDRDEWRARAEAAEARYGAERLRWERARDHHADEARKWGEKRRWYEARIAELEAAEARLADPYSQANQDAAAWGRVAAHPALRMDLLPDVEGSYADCVFERITWLAETAEAVTEMKPAEAAEARTAPAVTRDEVSQVVHGVLSTWYDNEDVVDAVCDLLGIEAEQATGPVEPEPEGDVIVRDADNRIWWVTDDGWTHGTSRIDHDWSDVPKPIRLMYRAEMEANDA